MDALICYDLLKGIDTDLLRRSVRDCLYQSLMACEADDCQKMLELARFSLQTALACQDQIGKAVSLIHLGMAHAQVGKFNQARDYLERAKRICQRNPVRRHRHNEGIAAFGLGLIYQYHGYGLAGSEVYDSQAKSIGYYQQALDLFKDIERDYAAAGDDRRFRLIRAICADVRERIDSQIPQGYLEPDAYRVSPSDDYKAAPDPQPSANSHVLHTSEEEEQEPSCGNEAPTHDVEQKKAIEYHPPERKDRLWGTAIPNEANVIGSDKSEAS